MTCKFLNIDDPSILLVDTYKTKPVYLYDYCEFNPVMYIDPDGFKLRIYGNEKVKRDIMRQVRTLTRHVLSIDSEGYVTIKYSVHANSPYKKGDKLIKRIINSKFNCDIYASTSTKGIMLPYDSSSACLRGIGTRSSIYYDPYNPPKLKTINPNTGVVTKTNTPAYIVIAHELIHADRAMRGVMIRGSVMANNIYVIGIHKSRNVYTPIYAVENVKKEELATVGLSGFGSNDITENMIRKEHGLWLRGAYYLD